MSRIAWSLPIAAVLGLTLVSCFDDVKDCPTCPPVNSGVIKISVSQNGLVDSVQIRVDGGTLVTVKRKGEHKFAGLSEGTHVVETKRWFTDFEIPNSRAQRIDLQLERGETRTVVFHNDFPLITWLNAESGARAVRVGTPGRIPGAPGA